MPEKSIQIMNNDLKQDAKLISSITATSASATNHISIRMDEYPDSFNMPEESIQIMNNDLKLDDKLISSVTATSASATNDISIHMKEYPDSSNMPEESIQIMNNELMLDDKLVSSVTATSTSAINDSSIHRDERPDRSDQIMNDEMLDANVASLDTASSSINNNSFQKDKYPESVDNRIIVGWATIILFLGLVTFSFPNNDDHHSNEAFLTYMLMLMLELAIWTPMLIHISPPRGDLKKTKLCLHVSFIFFNHVSNIIEQSISSIHYLNHGRLLIYVNLFCGVVSFFIISALFWLAIVLKRDGFRWQHFTLGCNAALSATILNISVFQLIVKKNFLHFPLFSILRDVIDLIDLIIRIVHKIEEHC